MAYRALHLPVFGNIRESLADTGGENQLPEPALILLVLAEANAPRDCFSAAPIPRKLREGATFPFPPFARYFEWQRDRRSTIVFAMDRLYREIAAPSIVPLLVAWQRPPTVPIDWLSVVPMGSNSSANVVRFAGVLPKQPSG